MNALPSDDSRMESLLLAQARAGACPPPDLLFAAEEDVLPAAAGASIRDHAAHCALCQTLLAELDPAKAAFSPAADARIQARTHARLHPRSDSTRKPTFWLSIAAVAAVLLVGVLGLLSYRLSHFSAGQSIVATNHPPAQPSADLPELHQIAPLAPPDDVPVLVTRGATAARGPSVDDLMPAFRAYNRNDFGQAAAAFAPLVARFPRSDIPSLYLGVSQLQIGQNADAQRSLAQAHSLTGSTGHDAATWYLAIADLRLHQSRAAVSLLWDLCVKQPNPYTARACTLARQIGPS
jgi:hypothetical protein